MTMGLPPIPFVRMLDNSAPVPIVPVFGQERSSQFEVRYGRITDLLLGVN